MLRSYALALSGAALLLTLGTPSYAQTIGARQQCVPAVADASMYHNCRLRIVRGQETCRCAIRPQALRRMDNLNDADRGITATGSIGSSPAGVPGSPVSYTHLTLPTILRV